jgi:hypothetical protein
MEEAAFRFCAKAAYGVGISSTRLDDQVKYVSLSAGGSTIA